jgi:hypothetical protein
MSHFGLHEVFLLLPPAQENALSCFLDCLQAFCSANGWGQGFEARACLLVGGV